MSQFKHERVSISPLKRRWLALATLVLTGPVVAGFVLPPDDLPVHDLVTVLEGEYPDFLDQDAVGGPLFGFSVAMYGDTLAVGAPGARVHTDFDRGGAVFVYERNGGHWTLAQSIPFDFFTLVGADQECGYSVALDAYNLLIGCPGRASQAGGAKLFTRPSAGAPFELASILFNPGDDPEERCGHSVSLLGNADSGTYPLAAIGCPGRITGPSRFADSLGPSAVGAVDLQFYCPPLAPCAGALGVGWHPLETFYGTLGVPGSENRVGEMPQEFGHSVSLKGYLGANVLLAVGAPASGMNEAGRVDVYRAPADDLTPWFLDLSISADQPGRLGHSIDLATSNSIAYLVAGAPTHIDASGAGPAGAVLIGTRTMFGWSEPEWLVADIAGEGAMHMRLGHAVHLASATAPPRLLAGAPHGPDGWGPGQALHYYRDPDQAAWMLNEQDVLSQAPEPLPTIFAQRFAWSMDGNGDWLALGGPGYVVANGEVRGRVFIYAWDNSLFRDRFED